MNNNKNKKKRNERHSLSSKSTYIDRCGDKYFCKSKCNFLRDHKLGHVAQPRSVRDDFKEKIPVHEVLKISGGSTG